MRSVPFQDLRRLHDSIRQELRAAIDGVLERSAFVSGADVADFEREFATAHGNVAAAACGSGTDALALTLRAAGIGLGDEVVVPSMTFVATAEAVLHASATPVLADVEESSLLLTRESVASVRTAGTRAVIPVHLYGHPVPPGLLQDWRNSGLLVVEDAAQAHIAQRDGVLVGTAGHAACFSFYPGKNLGALGDGGMVVSADEDLVATVRMLRDHGRTSKYEHQQLGWCSRMDGIQAAVLRVKLRHLPRWTEARRVLAARYAERLEDLRSEGVSLVPWHPGAVHHLVVIRVPSSARDTLVEELRESGVATGIHYPIPLSRQPSLRRCARRTPAAESAADQVISLPIDPLMSRDDVDYVCDMLRRLLGRQEQ